MPETINAMVPNMGSWHSYPKIFNLGHKVVANILDDDVIVEEKVDGSQFSFGRFGDDLRIRSRGGSIHLDAPEKMFARAVEVVKEIAPNLRDGWTYRGEYLSRPKHNVLCYERIPAQHVIIYDINTAEETYVTYAQKADEAARLGFEVVPLLHQGRVGSIVEFRELLDRVSVLGAQKVEGVVVKNYAKFTPDGKAMMAKFVSEMFKEIQGSDWKERNPKQNDIVEVIVGKLRTPARWNKAIQHLREAGKITDSPKDIGLIIREVQDDTFAETKEQIVAQLMEWAEGNIRRGLIRGFPEFYKEQLLKLQFERGEAA